MKRSNQIHIAQPALAADRQGAKCESGIAGLRFRLK